MTIFFGCSTKNILKHKDNYIETCNSIKELGHTINREWVDLSISYAEEGKPDVSPPSVYQDVMTAILTADMVVFDATERSMSVGHQLTFALQKSKPVLLLRHIENNNAKELFIFGTQSPLLTIKKYGSKKDILSLLKKFMKKYEKKTKTRFNLVLDNSQDNYIEWAAHTYNKSKTQVIHGAINNIRDQDQIYGKYLDEQS